MAGAAKKTTSQMTITAKAMLATASIVRPDLKCHALAGARHAAKARKAKITGSRVKRTKNNGEGESVNMKAMVSNADRNADWCVGVATKSKTHHTPSGPIAENANKPLAI